MEWLYRRDWLEQLFANRIFDYVLAPIMVLAIGSWLIADFVSTRRAVKRGEPLRVWYLRYPVYPDDLLYSYFVWRREYPAVILFAFLGLIVFGFAGLFFWATFWPPPLKP